MMLLLGQWRVWQGSTWDEDTQTSSLTASKVTDKSITKEKEKNKEKKSP